MKTVTGRRLGQSGPELFSAFLFSSFLHILAFIGAFVLFAFSSPRINVPPYYRVTLVDRLQAGLPAEPAAQPAPQPAPQPPKKSAKPVHRAKAKKAPAPKSAMPALAKKQAPPEPEYVAEDEAPAPPAKVEKKASAGVSVSAPGETTSNPYVAIVREKIERTWNPPPGAKETKATVTFRVIRSGRVTIVNLAKPSGNFYFDQAAMRAIFSASPLPPLPEEYLKDAMDFSVDLMAGE